MRRLRTELLVCSLLVLTGVPTQAQWGTLKGKIVLDGKLPEVKPLYLMGADIANKEVCAVADIPDDSLVIDPQSKGIANAIVWVVKKPAKIHPNLANPAVAEVVLDQVACRFTPRVLVLRTDQKIKLLNGDKIPHNTNYSPLKGQAFNPIIAANDRVGDIRQIKTPEKLPVRVTCNIHPWMTAHWLVVDHPYAAVTDKDGAFEIKDLPAGEHEIRIWHENPGYLVKDAKDQKKGLFVTIEDGKILELPETKVPPEKLLRK